jgi:hypothetical protein
MQNAKFYLVAQLQRYTTMAKTPSKNKTPKKEKKNTEVSDTEETTVGKVTLIPYASPLADSKLNKKVTKTIKKGEPRDL